MIALANKTNAEELKKIWQICFGDSRAYIDSFFQKQMKPENTLVHYDTQELPAAMLFLLPAELNVQGQAFPAQYLYAACTLPEYRGRGYMKQLVDAASELGKKRGIANTILVPAEESLFEFYKKCGYQRFFQRQVLKLSREELTAYGSEGCRKLPVSIANIIRQRNLFFQDSNSVQWPDCHMKYAVEEAFSVGGGVLCTDFGYAFYKFSDEAVVVYELTVPSQYFDVFLNLLLESFPQNETFIFHCNPRWVPPKGIHCEKYWYGMLRCEDTNFNITQGAGAYLSLALD